MIRDFSILTEGFTASLDRFRWLGIGVDIALFAGSLSGKPSLCDERKGCAGMRVVPKSRYVALCATARHEVWVCPKSVPIIASDSEYFIHQHP
jgi:hypothetical protein